jgi:hypothetical protein
MSAASVLVAIIKVSCIKPNFLSLLLCSVFVAGKVFPVTIFHAPNIPFLPKVKRCLFTGLLFVKNGIQRT